MDAGDVKERKVVIAMDGSTHSEYAFNWYLNSFRLPRDLVLLVHCIERHDRFHAALGMSDVKTICDILAQEEKEEQLLKKQLEKRLIDHKLTGTVKTGVGKPGELIVSAARHEKADLIVCGCRGVGKVRRTITGSVSDFIVHHSHVPVIVCRHPSHLHELKDQN
ncbi:universal stress protein in QAH/OAS sulfhydrylase 3'region-like [Ostrea edulis]|uniref:universal stress protein in QAH/OAS sulfhydrylase 3'region-like n=1 Tax=Ostrea edulis TaxID=37623 RepID=UPI0020963043|nr:universal stress protein in QAH/OAS sulfhydrylase 3'region-like [Ostrea edulis]